jgi:hypothetical protein
MQRLEELHLALKQEITSGGEHSVWATELRGWIAELTGQDEIMRRHEPMRLQDEPIAKTWRQGEKVGGPVYGPIQAWRGFL